MPLFNGRLRQKFKELVGAQTDPNANVFHDVELLSVEIRDWEDNDRVKVQIWQIGEVKAWEGYVKGVWNSEQIMTEFISQSQILIHAGDYLMTVEKGQQRGFTWLKVVIDDVTR